MGWNEYVLPAMTLVAGVPESVRLTRVAVEVGGEDDVEVGGEVDVEAAVVIGAPLPPQAAKQQTVMTSVGHRADAAICLILSSMAHYSTGIVLAQSVADW